MEAMPTAREPALRASWLAILYEPLLWAAFAAFVGGALGLFGTFLQAALEISYTPTLSTIYFVAVAQYSGQALAAFSLIGVPSLLGPHSRTKVRRSVVLASDRLHPSTRPLGPYTKSLSGPPSSYRWRSLFRTLW
jgi:hypothetical protein